MSERYVTGYGQRYAPGTSRIYVPGYGYVYETDTGLGSWLSEGIKKVVGKKAGKKLEKKVNRATSNAAKGLKIAGKFIPGAGQIIEAAADTFIEYKDLGARASKMSYNRIAEISSVNPTKGQALLQAKQMVDQQKAADKQAKLQKKLAKLGLKTAQVNAAAAAPEPVKKSSNGLLIVGGLAVAAYLIASQSKPKRRK